MSSKTLGLSDELHRYVISIGREDDLLRRLRAETLAAVPDVAEMQISPEQGQFMTFLAKALGARRAIEVGTFTGYSAICTARGLAEGGNLICIDTSDEWTRVTFAAGGQSSLEQIVESLASALLDRAARTEPLPEQPMLSSDASVIESPSSPNRASSLFPSADPTHPASGGDELPPLTRSAEPRAVFDAPLHHADTHPSLAPFAHADRNSNSGASICASSTSSAARVTSTH